MKQIHQGLRPSSTLIKTVILLLLFHKDCHDNYESFVLTKAILTKTHMDNGLGITCWTPAHGTYDLQLNVVWRLGIVVLENHGWVTLNSFFSKECQ